MRKYCLLTLTALLLGGCATTGPSYDRERSISYICYPGSAIKRPVSSESAYPDYMYVQRGSCLHN